MREVVSDLRAEAKRADERRLLVVAGEPDATRDRVNLVLEAADIDPVESTSLGSAESLPGEVLDPRRSASLLGTTRDAIVVDCHEACRPNAIGRAVGAVDGGGLLVLLTPPLDEWPSRRDDFDESLAVPPFSVADVAGHFRTRLVETLRQHDGIAIVEVAADGADVVRKAGLTGAPTRQPPGPPSPPRDPTFPLPTYEACLTPDQVRAVEAFEELLAGEGAVVLESDRGRGKSSAAGLAAAALALEGRDVLVTAPEYRNAAELFARAHELLVDLGELSGRDRETRPRRLETETGRVRYAEPATAAELPADPDVVLVDEAAALPVGLLTASLDAGAVGFATTIHGYEGAGRGFSVRFQDRLADWDRSVTDVRLAEPIRYAPGDPVEVWAFRALALDAGPAPDRAVTAVSRADPAYRALAPEELVDDESLLREAFGLLVLAHYRTEPNDLARLLDAPNVTTRALLAGDRIVSVALLAREGDLGAERRASMYEGERVRGNMLPDVLTSQLRDESAGGPVGWRVMRIATHPAVRSRGLGSRLLEEIHDEFGSSVDWFGVGYGATPELVEFWRTNGYRTVHLSTTRNASSGEHSAIMLRPSSAAGQELLDRHTDWFLERVLGMLGDPLADLSPDVVRAALRSVAATPALDCSPMEWRVAAGLPAGAAIFDTAPRPVKRLTLRHLVEPAGTDVLSDRHERLLVRKALQGQSWSRVVDALEFHSHSTCMRALGDAVGLLVDEYGNETAREERRRFE